MNKGLYMQWRRDQNLAIDRPDAPEISKIVCRAVREKFGGDHIAGAESCGLHRHHLRAIMCGRKVGRLSERTLSKISNGLGLPFRDLRAAVPETREENQRALMRARSLSLTRLVFTPESRSDPSPSPKLRVALAPQERRVLEAMQKTGQADGWLHDPGLIISELYGSELAGETYRRRLETVGATVFRLYAKGYAPLAGISEEAAAHAREQLRHFVSELEAQYAAGGFTWRGLGITPNSIWKLRRGHPAEADTIERVGRRMGLVEPLVAEASRAGALLYRYTLSRRNHKALPSRLDTWCVKCHKPAVVWPSDTRHPICERCDPAGHLSLIQMQKHDRLRQFTAEGQWLYETIVREYGSLSRCSRKTGITMDTLRRYLTTEEPRLAHRFLAKLVETITGLIQARGEDPAPYERRLREAFGRKAPSRPACAICGHAVQHARQSCCSPTCRHLRLILSAGVRTKIGKRLVAAMTASADVPASRAARLLELSSEEVEWWYANDAFQRFVARIRDQRGGSPGFRTAVAHVLEMTLTTFDTYLHGKAVRSDRARPVQLRYFRLAHVRKMASLLSMTETECLGELRAKGTFTDNAAIALTKAHRKLRRRRTGTEGRRGPLPSNCSQVQGIVRLHGRGITDKQIVSRKYRGQIRIPGSLPVRVFLLRHGQVCRACRPLVALDLHEYAGDSARHIARLLNTPRRIIARDLQEARAQIPYGLTTGQVIERAKSLGLGEIDVDTVREWGDSGQIPATRSSGGRRRLNPRAVSEFLSRIAAQHR